MKRPPRLSAAFVRTVADVGRFGDGRGGFGLSLLVQGRKDGGLAKSWSQRLWVSGGPINVGLGQYPVVMLSEARQRALDNRRIVERGEDPRKPRRSVPTFAEAAESYIETQRVSWRHPSSERLWRSTLRDYALPKLGSAAVDTLTPADVASVVLPLFHEKPDSARRLRRKISAVLQATVAAGHRADDPAGAVLTPLLPKPGRKPATHYSALRHEDVGAAVATVRGTEDVWTGTRLCYEFVALTACRSGEARGMTWAEVEGSTWAVPAVRTKMAKPLRVPLSSQALAVLEAARRFGDALVFPARRGGEMRDSTLAKVPRDLKLGTVHGLRASFRSWCSDSGVDHAAAELALGHVIGSATVAAYARSDLLEARRALMQRWADYIMPGT